MLIEQFIFTVIAVVLFILIFAKLIKANDTSYVIILILNAIGLLINFIEVLFIELSIIVKVIKYVLSIIIPIIIIAIEKKGTNFLELKNVLKAKIYLFFGVEKSAKEALITLVTKYPENYIGHKMLAEIYEKEGGMRKAIDEYVQTVDINKQDYDSYYRVADLLNQLEKKDEASEMLTNLLNKKPDYYEAAVLLGEILIDKERYKEATNIYLEALKYHPENYNLNYNLAIAYTMLNDFQSAKKYYEKAAEINSLEYNSIYSLAEIALIYKEIEEAEKYFIEVLESGKENLEADSYYELAKISLIKKDKEQAIKYANLAIEIDPKKMVDKIKKEQLFITILSKITMPFNLENIEDNKKQDLSKREIKVKNHLEEMADITRTLSYNDINLLKKDRKIEKEYKNEILLENKEKIE